MIEGKWFAQGTDISVPLAIRETVFGFGRDAQDEVSQQVVVYREGEPVGTARLWWEAGAFQIGTLGVLPEARGAGYGDLLIRLALFKALTHHATRVELVAAPETEAFFVRYGFAPVKKTSQARAAGIPMAVRAQDICLSHCQGCGKCGQAT